MEIIEYNKNGLEVFQGEDYFKALKSQEIKAVGEKVSKIETPGAYALGFFDGVHIGHRAIIEKAVSVAKENSLIPSVFTFKSEESDLKKNVTRLYSTEQKIELLERLGVERIVLADFSDIRDTLPQDFVKTTLCRDLNCQVAVSGFNFRFGKGGKGDTGMLLSLLKEENRTAFIVEEKKKDGMSLSATSIRDALQKGEVEKANMMLGSPYYLSGNVKRGMGKGKIYGFPTVNTDVIAGCPLRRGVYRTVLPIDGKLYTGVTNVGVCPTFGERATHAETFICDYEGDLYGRELKIYFMEFIRGEKVFPTPQALGEQIDKDKKLAIERNGELTWQEIGLN